MAATIDELAATLAHAREHAVAADGAPRPATLEEAERTAELLYARLRERGARQVGWKLGATDDAGQRRFGTDRPFVAPVHDTMTAPLGTALKRSQLVAPVLEVEIGIGLDANGRPAASPVLIPCAEIADSRFPGWSTTLPEAVADFGLQGLMLIGEPVAPVEAVMATAWLDDNLLATGRRTFTEAIDLAAAIDGLAPSGPDDVPAFVATGTITPALPLMPGRWRIDLGDLGEIRFEVAP